MLHFQSIIVLLKYQDLTAQVLQHFTAWQSLYSSSNLHDALLLQTCSVDVQVT